MKRKLKIGLVGCGAIGSYLAKRIDRELGSDAHLVAIFDINKSSSQRLRGSLRKKPSISNLPSLIKKSHLIIEAANVLACRQLLDKVISTGKDILVMSVGALLAKKNLIKKAKAKGSCVYIPSGAIAGIDAFRAAQLGKIRDVQLVTRKPASTLADIPYLEKKRISLERLKKECVVFDGNALTAISHFPKNINVGVLLSLVTLGPKKTRVKIIASPRLGKNIHEIRVNGDWGSIFTRTENIASAQNPKTSFLAMLSAFATIKKILSPVKIGS